MPPTVKSLDDRINDLVDTVISIESRLGRLEEGFHQFEVSSTDFRARGENTFAFLKWMGGFIAAAFLSTLFAAAGIVYAAGQLGEKVNTQTDNVKKLADEQKQTAADIKKLSETVARIEEAMKAKK